MMRVGNWARSAAVLLGLLVAAGVVLPRVATAQVAVSVSVGFPPPELPVYEQPLCPGEDYIWTPGYWAWADDDDDYYWVPGTWVFAPEPGLLWTPPYWGWNGVAFAFYPGYWGPTIGFYGGIVYGFGYFGHGYEGGRWESGHFYYNRTVNNINVTNIHNVYNTTVVNNTTNVTRVSYNGGNGGVRAQATSQEQAAMRQRHTAPVAAQTQNIQAARGNRELRASQNHGKPPVAATERPGNFGGAGVVAARAGGNYNPPPNRGRNSANRPEANRPNDANRAPNDSPNRPPNAGNAGRPNYVHPNDLPKPNRPDRPPSSGNARADEKYQRQVDKMYQKQEQEHQKLEQKQEQEHQRAEQQRANDARRQQMEQRHQEQTQQMEQRHQQQQQRVERSQPQPRPQPQQQRPNEKRPPGGR